MLASVSRPAPLRVLTCGSVDDGKSTLIGRLLFEAGNLPDDTLAALEADSRRYGSTGGNTGTLDFALLADGLEAERAQGITIDVAYRYFASPRRSFILADCPGHEQFTRNMVTGASTADVAVVLIDARKGVLIQTRRHALIAHALRVPEIILAVNKMDLMNWSEARFRAIVNDFKTFAAEAGLWDVSTITAIPMAAVLGANLTAISPLCPWYQGQTLLERLEQSGAREAAGQTAADLRLPIQWVCRPDATFRGYAGTLLQGSLAPGQAVTVLPSGQTATVAGVATARTPAPVPQPDRESTTFVATARTPAPGAAHAGDASNLAQKLAPGTETAGPGDAVMITLAEDIALGRGDLVVTTGGRAPDMADLLDTTLVWMSETPLLPERAYILRHGPAERTAQVTRLRHKLDVATLVKTAARTLALNDIASCELALSAPLVFDPYAVNRDLGGFILIDRLSGATVAAGMIQFGLRRAANIAWQAIDIDGRARAKLKGQRAFCVWLTGLSGSGKSTLANALEKRLYAAGRHTYVLDGDNIRHGLNRDLGFTDADRVENVRRMSEVARLMADAGLIAIVAAISPFRAERDMARQLFPGDAFIEIFVDSSLEVCERRDAKGLYAKARAGKIPNFTGITSAYETPLQPELHLDTAGKTVDVLANEIISTLKQRDLLG